MELLLRRKGEIEIDASQSTLEKEEKRGKEMEENVSYKMKEWDSYDIKDILDSFSSRH